MSVPHLRPNAVVTAAALAAVALLLPVSSSAPGLHAQETGALEGTIFDVGSLQPLEGVSVSVVGGDREAVTDATGAFSLGELSAGSHRLRLERPGYASSTESVEVAAGESNYIQAGVVEFSEVLDELLVLGRRQAPEPTRVNGAAEYTGGGSAADLLAARIPGLRIRNGGVGVGSSFQIRGNRSLTQAGPPIIIVDGVRVRTPGGNPSPEDPMSVLDEIPASQVESIEVLRGPASASRYPEAADGVIIVNTHSGSDGSNGG